MLTFLAESCERHVSTSIRFGPDWYVASILGKPESVECFRVHVGEIGVDRLPLLFVQRSFACMPA